MTNKALAIEVVKRMPAKATLDEIAEELAILAGIERGRRAADAGDFIDDEELGKLIESWHSRSNGPAQRMRHSKKSKATSPRKTLARPKS